MARPLKLDIDSGVQGWDAKVDTNDEVLFNAPIPIHEDATITSLPDLQTDFPAAEYDRCFIWINLTTYGMTLCYSNGTAWLVFGEEKQQEAALTLTTTQLITDQFVHYTGAGAVDYDFLAAASWAGKSVTVRNDASLAINLDPSGAEQINGGGAGVPLSLAVGETARVYSNGTALFAGIMS